MIIAEGFLFSSMRNYDERMHEYIWDEGGIWMTLYDIALPLGAIFSIIVLSIEAYKVMSKQQGFDIMAIGRPILFAIILSNWYFFTYALGNITKPIEFFFQNKYEEQITEINQLRDTLNIEKALRKEKLNQLKAEGDVSKIIQNGVENENIDDPNNIQNKEGVQSLLAENLGDVYYDPNVISANPIIESGGIKELITSVIYWIGETWWSINCWFIFLIKNIFLAVLVIVGPVTFVFSILPIWKSCWTDWIGRIISVTFYGIMAYFIMICSLVIIKYGLITDIEAIKSSVKDENILMSYLNSQLGTLSLYVIALITGSVALHFVPEIATWVVPSDTARTATAFMSGMKASTLYVAKKMEKDIKEAKKKIETAVKIASGAGTGEVVAEQAIDTVNSSVVNNVEDTIKDDIDNIKADADIKDILDENEDKESNDENDSNTLEDIEKTNALLAELEYYEKQNTVNEKTDEDEIKKRKKKKDNSIIPKAEKYRNIDKDIDNLLNKNEDE